MERGIVLPTAHLDHPDPECDLDYVPDAGRHGSAGLLLKNAFGFGGTNTCLVFGRCERRPSGHTARPHGTVWSPPSAGTSFE